MGYPGYWENENATPAFGDVNYPFPQLWLEDVLLFCLSVWARRLLLPALALSSLPLGACSDKPASDLGFGVSFACNADREQSDQLRLRILVGGCQPDAESRYEATLAKGESAPAANGLSPGTYGIEASSLSGGELMAYACLVANLPTTQSLDIKLESDNCDELDAGDLDAEVEGGTDDAEVDASDANGNDGGLDDADLDALVDDAGDADAEVDDAPIQCTESCDDGVPCTDDSCDTTSGKCRHMAFSGARECDGITCTQNDQCTDGTCGAGTPNDTLCPDDGQACTAEVCSAGVGCTRSNAGADGRDCTDNIICTDPDRCSNGICRGTDTCVARGMGICAASGGCVPSACPTNCDDGNPCTTDVCNPNGTCSNNANSIPCDDGRECTTDVCSNQVCVGTSTCSADATCGSLTCSCNDATKTNCDNSCVNLTNTATNCGSCTRPCGAGQSCENSACKPGNASGCTAHRYGGHDYLVCSELLTWPEARTKCRSWNMGLAIVDNATENTFIQQRIGSAARWIGANDRGNNGSNCDKSADEGTWFWANPNNTDDHATQFCSMSNGSCAPTSGRYSNWRSGEPNNFFCQRICMFLVCSYTDGEDCGYILPDGTWYDTNCSPAAADRIGYVCESP